MQKLLTHILSAKNIRILYIESAKTVCKEADAMILKLQGPVFQNLTKLFANVMLQFLS